MVEDLSGPGATPFQDWPSGTVEISLVEAGTGLERAFLTETVSISFDKKYIIVIGGDPLRGAGQPAIELWVFDWAREETFLEPFGITASLDI